MEHSTIISALTAGHKKARCTLLRSAVRQPRNGNLNHLTSMHHAYCVYALPKLDDKDTHTEYLITYYLCALLFPISFRGFWLNAK